MTLHRLELDDTRPVLVARLSGEVDASNAGEVHAELSARSDGRPVALDLSEVAYLDSAGLALLDRLRRETELRLVVPPESIVASVIKVAGLDAVMPIFTTVHDAVS